MDLNKAFPLCLVCLRAALFSLVSVTSADKDSHLSYQLKKEIANYQDDSNKIIDFLTKGPGKHQVYNRLATFVDTYGSRIAGSANLEHAIDYMLDELNRDKLDNVHSEEVLVPHWVRGEESAQMLLPRSHSVALLGLGSSVATPPGGITAEVMVVRSFDELHDQASKVCFLFYYAIIKQALCYENGQIYLWPNGNQITHWTPELSAFKPRPAGVRRRKAKYYSASLHQEPTMSPSKP